MEMEFWRRNNFKRKESNQYLQEGKYKITLTVSNAAGSNTLTKDSVPKSSDECKIQNH